MKRSIRKKMFAGFGLVILLMLSANVYVTYTIYRISRTTQEIVGDEMKAVTLSEHLKDIVRDQGKVAGLSLTTPDNGTRKAFLRNSGLFYAAMDSLFYTVADAGSEGFPIMHRIMRIQAELDSMMNTTGDSSAGPGVAGACMDSLRSMHDLIDRLVLVHRQATETRVTSLEERTGASIRVGVALTVSTLFVALILAYVIPKRITRPIDILVRGVEGIGTGRLKPVLVDSDDEITLLANAVKDLGGRLKETNELRAEITQQILHEIQSPLGAILSARFLLASRRGDSADPAERQLLESIRESVEKISVTIRQLLDIARLDLGKMEYERAPEDLATLLQSVVDGFRVSAAGKEIGIIYDPKPLRPVMIDRQKMEIVFNNLLSNAIKFTGEGGRIEILAREKKDSVSISIRDNGTGIEERHLPHIFTRFYTGGVPGKAGTGIGLSLARAFAEGHGGTIKAESTPGEGSVFTVHLPSISSVDSGSPG